MLQREGISRMVKGRGGLSLNFVIFVFQGCLVVDELFEFAKFWFLFFRKLGQKYLFCRVVTVKNEMMIVEYFVLCQLQEWYALNDGCRYYLLFLL